MHLFFLIHGFYGNKSHLEPMRRILAEKLPRENTIVYCAKSNESLKTFDGVAIGGYRCYFELKKLITAQEITSVSIIGYSMGGLYARYVIGLLEFEGFFDHIKPVNYVSVATPHLGSSFWKQTLWTRCVNGLGRALLGPSGFDLMSRGPSGILDKMVQPESSYINGLKRFENLVLFANAVNDRSVRFWSSFLTDHHPFPRNHKKESHVAFYSFANDPCGPIFVDLANSRPKEVSTNPSDSNKGDIVINFIWLILPLLLLIVLSISVFSWIRYVILKPRYTRLYLDRVNTAVDSNRTKKGSSVTNANESIEEASLSQADGPAQNSQTQKSNNLGISEEIHVAAEELIPRSIGSSIEYSSSVRAAGSSGIPEPAYDFKFVNCGERIPITEAVRSRLNKLNSLPWQKYVVYLSGRSHAEIIDRFDNGNNKGEQILNFIADKISHE